MKNILLSILLFLIFSISAICNEKIQIHKTDGTIDEFEITSEMSITFSDISNADIMKILKTDSTVDEFYLSDVIIVTFNPYTGIDDEFEDGDNINKLVEFPISLLTNYPNPFNPETKINFKLISNGFVTVAVYNQKGELVKKLLEKKLEIGNYDLNWDGKNDLSQIVSSGLYFTKVTINNKETKITKMNLLK